MAEQTEELQIDNRGSEDVPFGFVYIDGTRVGFSDSMVWPTHGWASTEDQQQQVADALTVKYGYGWYLPEEDYDDED